MLSIVSFYLKVLIAGLLIAIFIPYFYLTKNRHKYSRSLLSKLILKNFGVAVELDGDFDKDSKIYIVNHQSVLDIVAIEAVSSQNLCWIAKRELFDIPLFGHLFKSCQMIAVDRENKQGLVKLIKDASEKITEGRPLVIFPEGTRSKGDEMLEFKAGAKLIAEKLSLKVQPIVIVDSGKLLDTKHSKSASGGTLKIIFLEPFYPHGKGWLEDTRANMQAVLEEARAG